MSWPQTRLGCRSKERDFWHIHQTKVMMKIHDHDHDHNGVHDLSLRAILLALTLGWSIYLCFLIGKWVASFSSKSPPTIWYLCTNYLGTSGTSFLWISKVLWENQRIWILSIFEYLLKLLIRIYLDIRFCININMYSPHHETYKGLLKPLCTSVSACVGDKLGRSSSPKIPMQLEMHKQREI